MSARFYPGAMLLQAACLSRMAMRYEFIAVEPHCERGRMRRSVAAKTKRVFKTRAAGGCPQTDAAAAAQWHEGAAQYEFAIAIEVHVRAIGGKIE